MSKLRGKLLGLGGGVLLLMAAGVGHAGTVTYVYTDPQGTPLAEANASGTITATFDYAPYGSIALGTAPNGPGYTGHVNDPESGLVYMQARYYDPLVGRFLSVDPHLPKNAQLFSFNRYAYANNNPILNQDPDGNFPGPTYMLDWFHQLTDLLVVQPVVHTYQQIDQKFLFEMTAHEAPEGVGLSANADLLHLEKSNVQAVIGEGEDISFDISTRKPLFTISLGEDSDPSPVKLESEIGAGDVLHGGLQCTLDTNGNLTINPKFGFGYGDFGTIKTVNGTSVTGSVTVGEEDDLQDTERNVAPNNAEGSDQ
ncbi:RHS repeat-associated core domain-containing protein [Rhodanobacter sp. C03]|uniref:RHS repeat-associated core domain-containing protein n=1 Tax=Rhodanobacter sp. C03 TaxID=1945858 RepID=UPI0014399505|nr:RHS repeat-associated core domain-containing protein [Rhodanobacter sp. C03]